MKIKEHKCLNIVIVGLNLFCLPAIWNKHYIWGFPLQWLQLSTRYADMLMVQLFVHHTFIHMVNSRL